MKKVGREMKQKKEKLGRLIETCRGENSLRAIAERIGIPHSNLKYIEDGVNTPTPEVYIKIISALAPDDKTRSKMDDLYMAIRQAPPPDVCNIILQNKQLIAALRPLGGMTLTASQIQELQNKILAMAEENRKGETENAETL